MDVKSARVFDKPFQPSVLFVGKAGAYPNGALKISSLLG